MSKGINKVILIGNLGKDPEVRYMPSGGAVANLTIATSDSWKDKSTGENQERTEWHRVVMFNRLGEIAGEYLKKGSKVYIEGRLQTRKWQDNNGQDRYTTEIVASEMQMLDSRVDSGSASQNGSACDSSNQQQQGSQQQQGGYQQHGQSQAQSQNQQQAPACNGFDDFDSDIPF